MADLVRSTRIDRSNVSRRLPRLVSEGLMRVGQGRRAQYGLRRPVGDNLQSFEVSHVSEAGEASFFGTALPIFQREIFLKRDPAAVVRWNSIFSGDSVDGLFPSVPCFLEDAVPQGFFGRAFARSRSVELEIPSNLERWTDDDRLIALMAVGARAPGAFYLGSPEELGAAGETAAVLSDARLIEAVESVLGDGLNFGSSAGGEQPKFSNDDYVVKFSGSLSSDNGRRWGDLLVMEHLALETLKDAGVSVAGSELRLVDERVFLLSSRFDRLQASEGASQGRRAVVSLRALDAALLGSEMRNWSDAVEQLASEEILSDISRAPIARAQNFGRLIANNDMHFGNLSFFLHPELPLTLAPLYDMLPMAYAPTRTGEQLNSMVQSIDYSGVSSEEVDLAAQFWKSASRHPSVSRGMRKIACEHLNALAKVTSNRTSRGISL